MMLVFSPMFSYAKENGEKKEKNEAKTELRLKANAKIEDKDTEDEDREKKEERKESHSSAKTCVKAFGHLIAPGYKNKNGEPDLDFWKDCVIPFGIAKKLGFGSTTPSTTDTVAPVISGLAAQAKITEAIITWKTDERSDTKVYWSVNSPVTATSSVKANASLTTDHKITLKNLTATTTYYFFVSSRDKAGNISTSSEMSFATKPANADVTAPVISNVTISAGTTTAAVSWNTNENADSRVYWSTVNPLVIGATTTASATSSLMTQAHYLPLTGLSATTTYYFKVESADASGNISTSATVTALTH